MWTCSLQESPIYANLCCFLSRNALFCFLLSVLLWILIELCLRFSLLFLLRKLWFEVESIVWLTQNLLNIIPILHWLSQSKLWGYWYALFATLHHLFSILVDASIKENLTLQPSWFNFSKIPILRLHIKRYNFFYGIYELIFWILNFIFYYKIFKINYRIQK